MYVCVSARANLLFIFAAVEQHMNNLLWQSSSRADLHLAPACKNTCVKFRLRERQRKREGGGERGKDNGCKSDRDRKVHLCVCVCLCFMWSQTVIGTQQTDDS